MWKPLVVIVVAILLVVRPTPLESCDSYFIIPVRDAERPSIIYRHIAVCNETYMEILTREFWEQAPRIVEPRRHLGFGYALSDREQKAFVRIVFPWWD